MAKIQPGQPAPEFQLTDWQGQAVTLSQFKGQRHVLLVLNRGFF
ncbi:MAG: hypothetical protein D6715_11195 [Calditrichaeota bacterium]|nr:MAG: hypothetical protein D6715_11195 [Calditrichota bacterium]